MPYEFDSAVEQCFQQLKNRIDEAGMAVDHGRIRAAFELAAGSHVGQKRKDGSPYITHPIAAAIIVVDMGLDEDSIVSALLHDVVEDTSVSCEEVSRLFGRGVAEIVDGVTKLTRVNFSNKEDEQMENMRKMLMAMSRDIRVILIKLADRLHNMRTMEYQTPAKQKSKSMETMQIYAPIAHRLGMQAVKWELEDLSLLYLDPDAYKAIMTTIDSRRPVLEKFMQDMCDKITARLREWGIESTINYRLKHVHSIYRKMYTQKLELKEIFDLCALRVIVNDLGECYNVLGQIHDMFKPIPGRFKDYVSTPKPNGYQSVHTTVIGSEGIPFEVQIRTWDMHRAAEYGVAAHWKYKSGESGVKEGDEEKFAWVRRLLENQQSSEASDFFTDLQIDMFADEVFVFSPRGDVINLPANATPIDFAYNIHSAVGNRMVGAKVNGRIVPFDHKLKNGDIVEILTSKASSGPSRDWLNIARSGSARTKIKQWFKKERREENVIRGKEMFDAEMRRNGITLAEVTEADVVAPLLKKLSFATIEDLYAAIGYGGVTATKTVNRIRDDYIRAQKTTGAKSALEKLNDAAERRNKQAKPQKAIQGVIVAGIDNCLVKFARCCTPVPGDDIVGFITRGYGVSIHRSDCKNHISGRLNPDSEAGRWIDVSWAEDISESYVTNLQISARDRSGLLMDLATALNSLNAKVRSLNARDLGDGMASANLTVEVKDLAELKAIIGRLSAVRSVTGVTRSNN